VGTPLPIKAVFWAPEDFVSGSHNHVHLLAQLQHGFSRADGGLISLVAIIFILAPQTGQLIEGLWVS